VAVHPVHAGSEVLFCAIKIQPDFAARDAGVAIWRGEREHIRMIAEVIEPAKRVKMGFAAHVPPNSRRKIIGPTGRLTKLDVATTAGYQPVFLAKIGLQKKAIRV
jgi:hypothetical protein